MSRSHSRGREFESSGRGGVGNIRPQSRDPIARIVGDANANGQPGPDDFSHARGREVRNSSDEPITHAGRGGAGNIRSPSRDPKGERSGYEADKKLVKDYDLHQHIHSSGRGGVGNIDRSRSRSRSRDVTQTTKPPGAQAQAVVNDHQLHTAGRGGYGNAHDGSVSSANKIDQVDEKERGVHKSSLEDGSAHTSGRGGYGNTSSTAGYDTKAPHHATTDHTLHASGRGGAGNIHD